MPRLLLLAPLLLLAAGCTQFPEIDARVPPSEREGPPPDLIDVVPLLEQAQALSASPRLSQQGGAALAARGARLAARGAGARAPADPGLPARLRALTARAEALRAASPADTAEPDRP